MKTMEIKRFERVEAPQDDTYYKQEGIVAFQMVEIIINFFGKIMTSMHDTKILKDGRQLVINGNGFIEYNFNITNL